MQTSTCLAFLWQLEVLATLGLRWLWTLSCGNIMETGGDSVLDRILAGLL